MVDNLTLSKSSAGKFLLSGSAKIVNYEHKSFQMTID